MAKIKHDTNGFLTSNLDNYSLVDITHHIVGNELAIISGYVQLLLRERAMQGESPSPLNLEKLAQRDEKQLFYLQVIKRSVEEMDNFLICLHDCSITLAEKNLNEHPVKTDLVFLCKQVIENLMPLYKNCTLQIQLPVQPLYVLGNHLWMTLVLEHVIIHTVAAHTTSTPIVITIKECPDISDDLNTVKIGIHITRGSAEQILGTEEAFEAHSRMLDEKDRELCIALSVAILREYGGYIEREQEMEQKETVYIALPLAK